MHFLLLKYPTFLSVAYVSLLLAIETTTNWMLNLDQITQLGVVLMLSAFGGIVEFFRERREPKRHLTSLPAHCASALGGGVVMALLAYRIVEIHNQPMLWLALVLIASIFGNSFLNTIGRRFDKKLNEIDIDIDKTSQL